MNSQLKQAGKKIVELMGALPIMNELNFRFQQIWHHYKNNNYKKSLKRFVFPSDRALFNTFQLDYKKYYEDGIIAAKEMIEWGEIISIKQPIILDWGCGTGRVIRHISYLKKDSICYGADIDSNTIQWCRQFIDSVYFDCIEHQTLPYPSNYFHLVYGISVLTHIPHTATQYWLTELNRVLLPNGIAILSTHGANFYDQLNHQEKIKLQTEGAFSNAFKKDGDRSKTTYHEANHFKKILEYHFSIVEFWEGHQFPQKMGGQDCWVIRKK